MERLKQVLLVLKNLMSLIIEYVKDYINPSDKIELHYLKQF